MARKLKIMVASSVYHFEDNLRQICAVLQGFGYVVWNSHIGTIPVDPSKSNSENCIEAVRNCDIFVGIVRPFYGSSSITHDEFKEADRLRKPRWFLVHRDVTFARQLLKKHMYTNQGHRTKFQLKPNGVMDDLRVIDIYNVAIQAHVPAADRTGHWAQEFYRIPEALSYIEEQLKDVPAVRKISRGMNP